MTGPGARTNDLPHSRRARKPLHHRYRAVDIRSYNRLVQTYTYLLTVLAWSNINENFRSTLVHPRFVMGFVLLDLKFYVYVLYIFVCPFVLFLWAIVLSVLLPYTDSDYPFGICKLFLFKMYMFRLGEFNFLHGLCYIVEQLSAVIVYL